MQSAAPEPPTPGDQPLVTVGIPVRNGEAYLRRAVNAVLSQTLQDLELIISDNASTDRTSELCADLAASDPRVRIVRQDRNVGAIANFNRVLDVARGAYFCWLAHDDWFSPDYLERCSALLNDKPHVVLCYAMQAVVDETGRTFREQHERLPGLADLQARRRFHSIIWGLKDPTSPVFGLLRTAVVKQLGGMPNVPEPDRQLLYALSLQGSFVALPDSLFFHYGPPGHSAHYGSGPMRRRAWEWLHPDNSHKLMIKPVRVIKKQLDVVNNSPLSAPDKILCSVDTVAATTVRGSMSKARKLAAVARRRLRPA